VILAGGRGTRLAPYTTVLPKPLMPLGDVPILEVLLHQLRRSVVTHVTLAVGHLAPLLMAYFADGDRFGLRIDYSREDGPLGTAGPLTLVEGLDSTFLVMNGDLLTDLDAGAMVEFHRANGAVATIGVCERDIPIDLGVIDVDGASRVTGYREKPVYGYRASMGAYVFEPSVLSHIQRGRRFDLPELIGALLAAGEPVVAYTHVGYWLDIGRPDDYQRAQADFPQLRARLMAEPESSPSDVVPGSSRAPGDKSTVKSEH
jgi:NDP-sugar pyrophosphorylase family protein